MQVTVRAERHAAGCKIVGSGAKFPWVIGTQKGSGEALRKGKGPSGRVADGRLLMATNPTKECLQAARHASAATGCGG